MRRDNRIAGINAYDRLEKYVHFKGQRYRARRGFGRYPAILKRAYTELGGIPCRLRLATRVSLIHEELAGFSASASGHDLEKTATATCATYRPIAARMDCA